MREGRKRQGAVERGGGGGRKSKMSALPLQATLLLCSLGWRGSAGDRETLA